MKRLIICCGCLSGKSKTTLTAAVLAAIPDAAIHFVDEPPVKPLDMLTLIPAPQLLPLFIPKESAYERSHRNQPWHANRKKRQSH